VEAPVWTFCPLHDFAVSTQSKDGFVMDPCFNARATRTRYLSSDTESDVTLLSVIVRCLRKISNSSRINRTRSVI